MQSPTGLGVVQATSFVPPVGAQSFSAAAAARNLGVGWSGSGFAVLYFTGVGVILKQLGVINNATKLAGTSGGAITSAALCGGMSDSMALTTNLNIAARCRPTDACRGFLDRAVRDELNAALPLDAAARCNGRLWVTVTQARPKNQTDVGLLLGPNWTSRPQLVNAAAASSFIPGVQSGGLVTDALKGEGIPAAYDGGYALDLPTPPGTAATIHVQAFVTNPNITQAEAAGVLLPVMAAAADDAARQAAAPYLPLNPVPLKPPKPDISPGLSGPLRVAPEQWNAYGFDIPDNDTLLYLFDQGRADAAAFVRAKGLASAAAVDAALTATTPQALLGGGGAAGTAATRAPAPAPARVVVEAGARGNQSSSTAGSKAAPAAAAAAPAAPARGHRKLLGGGGAALQQQAAATRQVAVQRVAQLLAAAAAA